MTVYRYRRPSRTKTGTPEDLTPAPSLPLLQLLRTLSTLTTGAAIALALILALGVARTGSKFMEGVTSLFSAPEPKPEVDVRAVIVQQVRQVSELTTAVYTMEAVVPTKRDRTVGQLTLGSTTLLYIAHGEVRAGIDLSQITPTDITINEGRIELRLPPPKILDAKIDITRSKVYDYDRGFLGLGPDSAIELQSLASQAALDRIVATACTQDLLHQANQRAQLALTQLLSTTSYPTISIQTQTPTNCTAPQPQSLPSPSTLPPQIVQ